ncbi:MAG: PAS domain S-box protein [Sphingobacteriales bacterium]|nr:MAG: PAS domain S-box protein [Sphingobacteriales bacterium]
MKSAESIYQRIVEASPYPIYLCSGEELIISVANKAALKAWGRDESVIGMRFIHALPELEGQPFLKLLEDVFRTGEAYVARNDQADLLINGQIHTFFFDFSYQAMHDDEGKITGVLCFATDVTALEHAKRQAVKTQRDFQESESRFRTMAETTDVLISTSDATGNATYFNKAWTDLVGKKEEELLKFGWVDLIHPDDKVNWVNNYLAAHNDKRAIKGEFRIKSESGDYRWLLAKIPARFNTTGEFLGYIGSCIDITDRKQWELSLEAATEEIQMVNEELNASNEELISANEELAIANHELRQTQALLRNQSIEKQTALDRIKAQDQNIKNMVRQAPVGMCILQGDPLYIIEVNESFLELIGKTKDDSMDKPYWEVIAEAADYYKPITDHVLATGETFHADEHELMLIRNGKEEMINVDFVYEPMFDEKRKVYAIMIVAIDITDKVMARKKLQRAEESLRLAMEAAGLGSFSINPDTNEFKASQSMKTFFGLNSNDSISFESALNQIREDYRPEVIRQLHIAFSDNLKFDMEYPIIGYNDGQTRWVRAVGKMQSSDGKKAFTGVLNDITERRKDEERKNDFIGMVSHELKTPLTSMKGYVQMLLMKMRKLEDEFAISSLEKTNTQIGKMTTMINGFLNVSRLESGKIHIDHRIFDLAQLVKETEEEASNTISSHKIIFAPVEETIVNADRDKIGQVINNLISNAVKYSVAGSTIQVACVTIEQKALISVRDEGMGIKPQDAAKIFERYYRVEGSQMFSISGFGIGLYLCAEIIHRHSGEIWVDSDFGKGSTFSFSLPVVG